MSKFRNLSAGSSVSLVFVFALAYNFADRNIATIPSDLRSVIADNDFDLQLIALANATSAPRDTSSPFGLGRQALPEEIAAWDLEISPDGTGLPVGSGSVLYGEEIFSEQCGICHGDFAEGVDNWPELAGGQDTLADEDPVKTVGSYWPYLSTAWDYIHRSMPFGNAQSLSDDDVYAMLAYILYSNDIIDDEEFVLSNENFLDIKMPNAEGFIIDDRPQTEYPSFSTVPCMENCKQAVEITMRAAVLDVTPEDADQPDGSTNNIGSSLESEQVATVSGSDSDVSPSGGDILNLELVAAGEKAFKKCKSCHQIGDGAKNKTGPHLNNLFGRVIGSEEGYKYSKAMLSFGADGLVWDNETLSEFLGKPKEYINGTKMSFSGFKKESDIEATIEYLKSFTK